RRRHTVDRIAMRWRSIAPFCRDDDPQTGPVISPVATWRHSGLTKVSTTESHGRVPRVSQIFIPSHSAAPRRVHPLARLRGEIDLRAHLREASRVRGPTHTLGLAAKPPHPARKSAPTLGSWPEGRLSPRKRGEEGASRTAVHHFQRKAG